MLEIVTMSIRLVTRPIDREGGQLAASPPQGSWQIGCQASSLVASYARSRSDANVQNC